MNKRVARKIVEYYTTTWLRWDEDGMWGRYSQRQLRAAKQRLFVKGVGLGWYVTPKHTMIEDQSVARAREWSQRDGPAFLAALARTEGRE